MKYYSPKIYGNANWLPLIIVCAFMNIAVFKSAFAYWNPGVLVIPIMTLPLLYYFSKLIYFRLTRPAIEILKDKVIVQNRWGKFIDVTPFENYSLVESTDFFAFRKDKENDVTMELNFISKKEWPELKRELNKLSFINAEGD